MEFKKLSDVEVVAEPMESANVLIEENGVIKKAPKTAVGGAGNDGGGSGWDAVFELSNTTSMEDNFSPENLSLVSGGYEEIKEKVVAGEHPKIMFKWLWNNGDNYYETFTVNCVQYCENISVLMSSWYNRYNMCGTFKVKLSSDNTVTEASYSGW